MKPEPVVPQADLRRIALETMAAAKFPMLASVEGAQPRLRPVSPVKIEDFTVFVASMRSSGKTAELEQNSRVELCYLSEGHDQVRITGVAELVTDRLVRQQIWDANSLLRIFLQSIDNPEFMLYRVTPLRVRFMREWALEYQEVPF
ncbi:MAG TPA: pyridoxamine 5'-phosphate oxidase family protein [Bryobacteraceae bacterium]|jgi:general stress protein 26|nr:pyridoxamine 5'-phosphate oxidase family protein [Bryobacteraceae bacterium]